MSPSAEVPSILRLAAPLVLVNLGNKLMGIVDTMLAGRLGPVSMAATGLGADMFFTGSIVAFGVIVGMDPLVAQSFGAGRLRRARRTMWQGLYAAALLCVPVAGAVLALAYSLETFGIAPGLAQETRAYVGWRLPSLLPLLAFVAGRTYLQAAQRTQPIVVAMVAANVFNAAAAWSLCYGVPALGVPALGVRGLAIATSMATLVELAVLALALRRLEPGDGGEPLRALEPRLLGRIFAVGLPIGVQHLAEIGIFVLVGVLMARIGPEAAAAHQVAIGLASLTFMVPLAVATATSVRVGHAIGAGEAPRMRAAGFAGIRVGALIMLASGVGMIAAPEALARLWTSDAAVVPLAAALIRIAAAFQIFDGVQVVAAGALRGTGLTRLALAATLVAYWLVALPVALLLAFRLGLGPQGLWWGLTAGLATAAVALTIAFARVSRRPVMALEPAAAPEASA